jgi:hypothetical protein
LCGALENLLLHATSAQRNRSCVDADALYSLSEHKIISDKVVASLSPVK